MTEALSGSDQQIRNRDAGRRVLNRLPPAVLLQRLA
jgi:hypothetical protein